MQAVAQDLRCLAGPHAGELLDSDIMAVLPEQQRDRDILRRDLAGATAPAEGRCDVVRDRGLVEYEDQCPADAWGTGVAAHNAQRGECGGGTRVTHGECERFPGNAPTR